MAMTSSRRVRELRHKRHRIGIPRHLDANAACKGLPSRTHSVALDIVARGFQSGEQLEKAPSVSYFSAGDSFQLDHVHLAGTGLLHGNHDRAARFVFTDEQPVNVFIRHFVSVN